MRLRLLIVACAVFLLDRVTKVVALGLLHEGRSIPVAPGALHITLVFNKGIAFGLFGKAATFVIPASMLTIALIGSYALGSHKGGHPAWISCGLILGGAIGNLYDRLRYGHVIDFLDFRVWPVFNIADSAITIGAVLLAWEIINNEKRKTQNAKRVVKE